MSIKNVANIGSTTESTLSNLQSLPLMTIQGLENTSASAIFNITEGTFKFYSTYDTTSSTFNLAKLQGKSFKLQELEINGQKTVGFSAPDAVDATYSITMPPEVPVVGGVMVVNSFDSQTGEAISEWKIPSFLSTTSTPLPYSFASFDPNLEVVSIGPLANNQLFTGVTGNFPQIVTLTNTANITYTNGSGVLSFNTIQDINAAASPTFTGVTLTGIAPNQVLTTNGASVVTGTATLSADKGGLATNASAFTGVVKANAGAFSASALVNADVASGANIDAAKIGTGVVSTTEFNYLDGVTSPIQTQLNTNATGLSDHLADTSDAHDASAISNIPAGNIAATDVQAAINELDAEKQPIDATLTALAAYNTNGFVVQTAADTFAGRSIAAGTGISVTNGDGVAGNPTITNTDLGSSAVSTHVGFADPHTQYLLESDAATTYQPLDSDLTAIAGLATTGIIVRTNAGTAATRTITAGSAKVSVTAGDGVAGNPIIDVSEANLSLNNISGTLSETKGGTAQATYATGDILYASGANTLSKLPIGAATQVLTVSGGVPTWGAAGTTTIGTIDSQAKSANGLVISSGAIVAQTADASFPGMVSTSAQTIAGSKTFSSNIVAQGGVSANAGFGLESATSGALNVGTTGNTTAVNIGTAATTQTINIGTGAGTTTINLGASGDTVNIAGTLTYVNTTNLEVTDKRITVNKGGTGGSEAGSGVEVEDNGSVTSYYQVNGTRTGWSLKAPTTAGVLDLVPGSNATTITASGGSITLPNVTGTVITSADTGSVTSTMIANNTIMDGDINASAAIAHSKLANITAGSVLLGNASNVPTATALSGDVTINSSGVTTVGTLTDKTLVSPLIQRMRLADAQVSTAGPALALQAAVTTYRLQTGFGTSLSSITGANDGDTIIIINEHGTSDITVVNSASLYTGTGADLILKQNAAITLTYDSTGTKWNVVGGAGGGGLTPATRNSNFTASAGFNYLVDTSAAAVTATLPNGAAGSVIRFTDAEETWGNTSRALTITPASGQKIGQQAINETLVMDVSGSWVELTWDATNSWWTIAAPSSTAGTAVLHNGNTIGSNLVLGTNDNFGIDFETNGSIKASISSAGIVTLGQLATSADAGQAVIINGGLSTGATGTGSAERRLLLNANTYGGVGSTALPSRNSNGGTLGGAVLRIAARTSDTENAFQFATNLVADSNTTATTTIGNASQAGAWTLGPSSSTNVQIVNGAALSVRSSSASNGGYIEGQQNGTAQWFVGKHPYNLFPSTTFGIGSVSASVDVTFGSGNILVGGISTAGAWTLGPSGFNAEHRINSSTTTAAPPTNGAAGALTANPAGYIVINVNGTLRRIPYYNN